MPRNQGRRITDLERDLSVTPWRHPDGMDSDNSPPSHTQPLQLAQSLAMAATITEADRSDLIEMLHELAERRRADVLG
jgi:hypothetical protein